MELLLLTAPPAAGKTHLVLSLISRLSGQVVFVSPLKALAIEFYQKAKKTDIKVCMPTSEELKNHPQAQLIILIPEQIQNHFYLKNVQLVVFDEFHLVHHWGLTFRPGLMMCFENIGNENIPVLALTATLTPTFIAEINNWCNGAIDCATWINIANMELKYTPSRITVYFNSKKIFKTLKKNLFRKNKTETFLFFVPYRQAVTTYCDYFKRRGVRTLGAVGGETLLFSEKLKNSPGIDLIIATDCLSHGVNLPPISQVFIAHPVFENWKWLQMTARGGRDGSHYQLHCRNHPKWGMVKNFCYKLASLLN